MLGLGVVGVGDVAQRDYLPELSRLAAKARPVVACSRSAGRAAEVAERFGIGRWTTSYEEVVTAGDVDAVLNLTPFEVHEEVTLAALGAGKHVYSEKPCATSAAGATRLLDAERKAGRIVVAAPSVLVFPQLQRAKEVLASGRLGKVHNRGDGHSAVCHPGSGTCPIPRRSSLKLAARSSTWPSTRCTR